jgi:hypothetical protein
VKTSHFGIERGHDRAGLAIARLLAQEFEEFAEGLLRGRVGAKHLAQHGAAGDVLKVRIEDGDFTREAALERKYPYDAAEKSVERSQRKLRKFGDEQVQEPKKIGLGEVRLADVISQSRRGIRFGGGTEKAAEDRVKKLTGGLAGKCERDDALGRNLAGQKLDVAGGEAVGLA